MFQKKDRFFLFTLLFCGNLAFAAPLKQGLVDANIAGGLIVQLDCGEGASLSQLYGGPGYIVHGLDTDQTTITTARSILNRDHVNGPVSVAHYNGKTLPYIDNSVNFIISEHATTVSMDEIKRVLVPGGSALIGGKKVEKKRSSSIDEWTHYLYKANNNAVSKDIVVAPPRRLQWMSGPKFSRHHDRISSFNAMVTAQGRIFTIIDEGPMWAIQAPPEWVLTARDAFNGKRLWTRSINTWQDHLWGLKGGPAVLPRRLVAVGDQVFTTLGLNAPVSVLNAQTGETIRTLPKTEGAREILVDGGVVYIVGGNTAVTKQWHDEGSCPVTAFEVQSGKQLWRIEKWVVPGTFSVLKDTACFLENNKVTTLDAKTGLVRWSSDEIPRPKKYSANFTPAMVLTEKVILIAGGEASAVRGKWNTGGAKDTLTAFDATTGKELWNAHHPDSGYASPEDLFVINGMVWFSDSRDGEEAGNTYGLDLMTGEVKVTFPPDIDTYWFHHRCYRAKATENWLLLSRTGVEFIDFKDKHWEVNHWIRGACLYGILPANGLLYAPQDPCACYAESKQNGLTAAAPAGSAPRIPATLPVRLIKGPAFDQKITAKATTANDWPLYRGNVSRSGTTTATIKGDLKPSWTADVGGKVSPPVVSGSVLLVAAIDQHAIHAFNPQTGTPLWQFTAGGRIDSAPSMHNGYALFGSKDGYVYCLQASTGKLVWKFRAAPIDQRLVIYEQLESVWPVHGSVLVDENVVSFMAGRSSFMDGGVRFIRLDSATGALLSEEVLDGQKPKKGKGQQDYVSWLNMPPAKTDLLSRYRDTIYMGSQGFDLAGKRLPLKAKPYGGNPQTRERNPDQDADHAHIFSPTGFLDDSSWHRSYWLFGSDFYSGWDGYYTAGKVTPAGKILVTDDDTVYGFGRLPEYWRWTQVMEFHVFAISKDRVGKMKAPTKNTTAATDSNFKWSQRYPILARALVATKETLYAAGPADVYDETKKRDPLQSAVQVEHWEGKHGGILLELSKEDGSLKKEHKLDSIPVFDGMMVAQGRLYISTVDGKITCLSSH